MADAELELESSERETPFNSETLKMMQETETLSNNVDGGGDGGYMKVTKKGEENEDMNEIEVDEKDTDKKEPKVEKKKDTDQKETEEAHDKEPKVEEILHKDQEKMKEEQDKGETKVEEKVDKDQKEMEEEQDKDGTEMEEEPDLIKENTMKYGWITNVRDFIKPRRIDLAMWMTRLSTLFFITFAIFPFFGGAYTLTRRALICNAITSGMRLYQRIPRPFMGINKEVCGMIVLEDAFHYLLYSLIFLFLGHVSFCLIPIFLFSTLHVANFSLQLMGAVYGEENTKSTGLGSTFLMLKSKTSTLLKLAATAEVAFMGLIFIHCFRGIISWITPFAYYRFLSLRYVSKRNPHTRTVMYQLRMTTEAFMNSGKCPLVLARILRGFINLLCKLSPY